MNRKTSGIVPGKIALLLAAFPFAAGHAPAAEYWLQAGTTTVAGVPMWGYALCGTGSTAPATCEGAVTVPGPALSVPPGDNLVVHLKNTLPEPTSLVISGQVKQEGMVPVWFEPSSPATVYTGARPPGNTTARVRSFDVEAAPSGGTATYAWAAIKPGTYLYSSGTHRQVQVQMGLYGALTKDAAAGNVAYRQGSTDIAYANQITLLYSEIDPALHAAVSNGSYRNGGISSTLEYRPRFFLINGKAFPDGSLNPLLPSSLPPGETAVPAGQNLLLRFLNAGLKTHVPTIAGQYWQMIAEDGNPLPYVDNPRQQYTAFLPAGKTVDVLLRPDNPGPAGIGEYAIFDSRNFDTTDGAQGGGFLAKLRVKASAGAAPVFHSVPVAAAAAGMPYSYQAQAVDPDGQPVTYALVTGANPATPPAGMSIDSVTGLLSWPAQQVTAGSYPVTVRASDSTAPAPLFKDQTFTLTVSEAGAAGSRSSTATARVNKGKRK